LLDDTPAWLSTDSGSNKWIAMMRRVMILLCVLGGPSLHVTGVAQSPELAMISVDSKPPTTGQNAFYVGNREPLVPNPLLKLPIGSVMPRGWLRTQLELMAAGLAGHLPELSKWCKKENNAWLSPTGEGEHGWEELPYWLRGFGDLGYVLGDERIINEARVWIEGILGSQRSDGYFGPESNREKDDLWPNMIALNILQTYYEYSHDERVLPFMTRYFHWQMTVPQKKLLPGSWQKMRAGDNLESIYWLYNRSGEAWLLELAERIHERTARWDTTVASWHGVNICQAYREPAIFYLQSHDRRHLDAAERNYQTVMALYGQVPGGMFGADENARPGYHGPRQAAETCSMVEFMHSFEMLFTFTGDPVYADRCEEVAFNSLPAAFTPDYKGLHYLTAPNCVQLDRHSKSPGFDNGGTMLSYSPHDYRCCQHNHAFGWSYYAEHLWMATRDNGLAAMLYAANDVKARVGDGAEVTIREDTDYPFDERIALTVSGPRPVRFPLYLRIPNWAEGARLTINGEAIPVEPEPSHYVRVEREWEDGDKVELTLPMEIEVRQWRTNADSVSVRRGPLWYALRIGEQWEQHPGSEKQTVKPDWPAWEVFPATPWNYGLVLEKNNPAASFKLVKSTRPIASQPFTLNAAPLTLVGRGKRIPVWQVDHSGLCGELQASPVRSDAPTEQIELIPMGCARLRISAFPVIGDGPDASEWTPPAEPRHAASFYSDDIRALSDSVVPHSSGDRTIPRFTFWPHKGTTEWVTWRFDRPRKVCACEVYWFEQVSGGYSRVPESWKVLYLVGEEWREVENASGYGVERDRFNRVTFDPVETTKLKLVMKLHDEFTAGVLEWMVE